MASFTMTTFRFLTSALLWLLLGLVETACSRDDTGFQPDTGRQLCEGDFCSCWSDDDCTLTGVNSTTCYDDCCSRIPIAKKFVHENNKIFEENCSLGPCPYTCPRTTFRAACFWWRCAAVPDIE